MPMVGTSWGGYPRVRQRVIALWHRDQLLPETEVSLLPYGNGRSYGDSCLNDGGVLLYTRGLNRFMDFDSRTGRLRCEAGVLLAEILALCVPQGWFLPVSPGTQFVTLGGAIANDVHGKNHHVAGTFGCHVAAFELLRSDGRHLLCTPETNPDWFTATIGGLGLTGLITWAEIQLKRIGSPWLDTESHRFTSLREFFALSEDSNRSFEYTVAWVDCGGGRRSLGRGLFMRAQHAPPRARAACSFRPRKLSVPFMPPFSLINPVSLRAFNWLYYHRQVRQVVQASTHYVPFFYPLDSIRHWNRIYGPRGFLQYQCVVPPETAEDAITELLKRAAGRGSFLAVLKQFGERRSPGLMSFPRPGATLAMDFPNSGESLLRLLEGLDDIVVAAGGAVYPAKDARMRPADFHRYFPAWERFRDFVDPRFSSSFWRRVTF